MNSEIFVFLMLVAFEGAVMLLLPHYSPRRFLFAVTVDADFRRSEPAREALRRYHWEVAGVLLLTALAVVVAQSRPNLALGIAGLTPWVAGMAVFLHQRNVVRRQAAPAHDVREADLAAEEDRLPWWFSFALPPFAAPAVAALYIRAHWDQIPARFPVHWGVNGSPDRWATKTPLHVYGTLLFAAGLMLMMLVMTQATFYGARRTSQRRVILKVMVLAMYLLTFLFTAIALSPLSGFSVWWIILPVVLFTIIVVVWLYRAFNDPRHPPEPTPDECWYLGLFYYNPQDPAVFVPRRVGLGYTFNFGTGWAWIILTVFLATTIGLAIAMRA